MELLSTERFNDVGDLLDFLAIKTEEVRQAEEKIATSIASLGWSSHDDARQVVDFVLDI